MCAISGSYSLSKLKELYELNSYRGVVSSSLAAFDEDSEMVFLHRVEGRIPDELWQKLENLGDSGCYFICHSQAPTSADTNSTIHPATGQHQIEVANPVKAIPYNVLLWHNGIIKPSSIEEWNKILNTSFKWDTALLAQIIAERIRGLSYALSNVNGSFACVLHTHIGEISNLYLFRNEISPLFIDDDLNISSTRFDKSRSLEAGLLFELDVRAHSLFETHIKFKTAENPYFLNDY